MMLGRAPDNHMKLSCIDLAGADCSEPSCLLAAPQGHRGDFLPSSGALDPLEMSPLLV